VTTTENDLDPSYAALTHFVKLGTENYGDSLVFRADTADDLLADIKEAAELSRELQDAGATLKEAFGVKKAAEEKAGRGTRASARSSSRGASARTASNRSTRPGSRPARKTTKRDEPPLSDELCDCGEPYKDLDGMTYAKGPKAGELYPYRFYASCDNRDCKPFGDHS
jgi:hypothetical protein